MIDNLDRALIDAMQKDGRITSVELAKKLKISDATVRFRLKKLTGQNILRITAGINPLAFQEGIAAYIGIELEKRTHPTTMQAIANVKGVVSVCNVTGRYDLLVEVFFESRQDLRKFLFEDLLTIKGINRTETFVVLEGINKWTELAAS
ncbi:MAG: Lrp/AsnC family transcriptional regulator [Thermodesulfobacteriota bacterium]